MQNLLWSIFVLLFRKMALRLGSIVDFCGFGPPMTMIKCANGLCQHFPDEVFPDVILWFATSSNQLLKVSSVTMLHDDEYFSCWFVYHSVVVLHDVLMTQFPKNIDFRYDLLFFFLAHNAVVKFFPDKHLAVRYPPYFLHFSKWTFSYVGNDFILWRHFDKSDK